jgi:hypothetical protein
MAGSAGDSMASQDWNPLSYFREMGTLSKVLLLLGFVFLAAGLAHGDASPSNRTILVALSFVSLSLACHYISGSLSWQSDSPYKRLVDWQKMLTGIAMSLVTLGLVVWSLKIPAPKVSCVPTNQTSPSSSPQIAPAPVAVEPPLTEKSASRPEAKKPEPKRQPNYSIGTATGSIVNQGSPNSGSQTVNNIDTSRRLTLQQIAAMKSAAQSVCATLPMINVTASNGNQEAQRYAYDFIESLKGGGCKADLALPIPGLTPDVSGVRIAVRDYKNIDPAARTLGKILSDTGIPFVVNPMKPDFFPDSTFVLVIGSKD